MYRLRYFLIKLLIILGCLGSLAFSIHFFILGFNWGSDDIDSTSVTYATLLLILSFTLLQFSCASLYNSMNDGVKTVDNKSGASLDTVFEAFKELETCFGKPWMGRVRGLKAEGMDVILFGPNADGEYIYIHSFGKTRLAVSQNDNPSLILPNEGDEWRLAAAATPESLQEVVRYQFVYACLLPEITDRVQNFLNTGAADLTPLGIGHEEDIYFFDEDFRWTGQDFYLSDLDGEERLKISSNVPCKTFRIFEIGSETEIFKLTKRIFHIFPTYDLYEGGQKIGRMKKRFILHHKHFVANTIYGKLEMRSMNATFGSNYQVRIDGRQIGTVARKLNIALENIVFDNYVLSVVNEKYLPLMAAMAVMSARESQRDKVEEIAMVADGD